MSRPDPNDALGSFAEVASLPDGELRELLGVHDDVVRVWAAWELGLRLGGRVGPTLTEVARAAPEPGVRRQLAVVLAGLGELDALLVMADDDPDAAARATAARYLARLAPGRPEAWAAVERLLADASPLVREVLVQEVARAAPAAVRRALVLRTADASVDVRRAVVDRVEEDAADAELGAALRAHLLDEHDDALRGRGVRLWAERGDAAALVAALGASARKLVFVAMIDARVAPDDAAGFGAEVLRGLQALVADPLAARRPFGRAEWSALVRVRRALGRSDASPLVAALVALLDATLPPRS